MEHIVRFERGFDCIKFECAWGRDMCKPGTGGSHGRHGLNIRFVVKGDDGAVQFLLYTGWTPQHATPSDIFVRDCNWSGTPFPADLGYHSKTPHFEGHEPSIESCEFCDGKPCYCDGSILNANDAMYALVNGGEDALWEFLDAYYESVFNGADYPQPAEYKMPLRADLASFQERLRLVEIAAREE
jgi:hypothetical protein